MKLTRFAIAFLSSLLPVAALAQDAAPKDTVAIVRDLGPLADNLVLAVSMDRSANGSVVFSSAQQALQGVFFGPVRFVKDGDRQCVNFATPGAILKALPPLKIDRTYTLATWMKLPCPGNHGIVWESLHESPLVAAGDHFGYIQKDVEGTYCTVKDLTGWHHVAVTCDGSQMTFFLDGESRGTAPVVLRESLQTIGTATYRKPEVNTQCDCLDDMFIFNRALNQAEIGQLSKVRLPIHEPTPADLAGQISRPTPAELAANRAANHPEANNPAPNVAANDNGASADAAELVKTYRNSLVFVSGTNGAGSGFLATYGKGSFLFTNAHVAAGVKGAGFKTLNGDAVQVGAASAAVGHDIVLMQTAPGGKPFEIMQGVDKEAAIGDAVVVLGNAEGAGVVNTIMGHIVGIGPNLVEVDAPFVPGNSGSPIIHIKSGKVVGVATYVMINKMDPVTKKPLSKPVLRHFGYRIDSVKAWQPINWAAFAAQAATMENIEAMTKDLVKLIVDIDRTGRITPGLHTNPAIKSRIDDWLGQKHTHMSQTDTETANYNFVSYLKSLCRTDVVGAHASLTYDYFQRQLTEQERDRDALADGFGQVLKTIKR
ncbi:trypsin-like peptidase domain-containing protein [Chthoniobacter flavus]|nr:trypsin-like peptidase domain-containing protein [Chthoniobacter flavus]